MSTPAVEKQQAEQVLLAVTEPLRTGLPLLFLHALRIRGFRSIEDATFTFQPGLNVIIGANNAAKSAVIDALRIVFNLGTFEQKEDPIRVRPTDVFLDGGDPQNARSIVFSAEFYGKADSDLPAQFIDLLCPAQIVELREGGEYAIFKIEYRADFEYSPDKRRYAHSRTMLHGGATGENPVTHETLDAIRSIYLAPLRDLVNDRARVGAEIERLILSHTPKGREEERAGIPARLRTYAEELIRALTGDKHQDAAGANLSQYAQPYGIPSNSLSFLPAGISESLFASMWPIFAHGLHGPDGLPLSSNGLGINQLIYASIVLSRRGDAEVDASIYKFFLIEEPEAHLHPQLQDSFFHALNLITDHQLFVTSHSPAITAKTDLDKIIVMRRDAGGRCATPLHLAAVFDGRDSDKKYLHKFLDVTRSQLLFASGAIFVEGVTEALLMQPFSEIIGRSLRDAAVEVVIVDSNAGFDHFRPLFDHGDGTYCRAVFITDGDESAASVLPDEAFFDPADEVLDRRLDISGNTAVSVGYGTFEFGLVRAAVADGGNAAMQGILREAMKSAAPSDLTNRESVDNFVADFLDFDRPALAYQKMKEKHPGLNVVGDDWHGGQRTNGYFQKAKSDFAFYLREELDGLGSEAASVAFRLPKYIQDAIEYVVDAPAPGE